MPECMHDTNAGFDLKYPEKNSIKLKPHSHTCINLKIALEIPATTMVQLASKMSVGNREKLEITARGIQGFGSMGRIDISVNMTEEKIVDKGEIILANSPKNIKIPIHNTTGNVIEIPKGTIIGYLTTKIEDQPPNHIPDFPQLCEYVNITSQTIYG
ncbi:hypothetical protein G9A89_017456 [Geosiphon pyriformis]|nr:hypothetical protein G9A89_017456 [Geosiphon pyriformis]